MKGAQKRVEKLRRVVGIASENLEAFDEDLGLHGDNIVRLTKLRDELKNHVAQIGEEKERRKAQTPADIAIILAYSSKLSGEEA